MYLELCKVIYPIITIGGFIFYFLTIKYEIYKNTENVKGLKNNIYVLKTKCRKFIKTPKTLKGYFAFTCYEK